MTWAVPNAVRLAEFTRWLEIGSRRHSKGDNCGYRTAKVGYETGVQSLLVKSA
jgi:hypothetical protein